HVRPMPLLLQSAPRRGHPLHAPGVALLEMPVAGRDGRAPASAGGRTREARRPALRALESDRGRAAPRRAPTQAVWLGSPVTLPKSPAELPRSAAEARALGSRRYFTGRPCSRGHLAPRRTCNETCIACEQAMRPRYRRAARERARAALAEMARWREYAERL